jgi:hypothetical protein
MTSSSEEDILMYMWLKLIPKLAVLLQKSNY